MDNIKQINWALSPENPNYESNKKSFKKEYSYLKKIMKAKQKKVAKTVSTKKTKKATNSLKAKALHSPGLDAKITKMLAKLSKL